MVGPKALFARLELPLTIRLRRSESIRDRTMRVGKRATAERNLQFFFGVTQIIMAFWFSSDLGSILISVSTASTTKHHHFNSNMMETPLTLKRHLVQLQK